MDISPNLLNLTVAGHLTAQNFYDAPVGSKPIVFIGLQMVDPNLVTAADNGSFGTPPRFSIKAMGSDGSTLGYELLNSINYTPIPVWYQGGFLFNSGPYSPVTVKVISEAPFSLTGNDHVIDELSMFQTNIINLVQLQKIMTPSTIYASSSGAGQDVTVTVTVTNTATSNAPNVVFQGSIGAVDRAP